MPDPTPDAIREAFLEHCRREGLRTFAFADGFFNSTNTEIAWRAFQAGAAWAAANKEQDDDRE